MNGYPKVEDSKNDNYYDALIYGWVAYVRKDDENFLKYGIALFMFATEVHDTDLMDDIYKYCLKSFEEDPEINKAFLGIITTLMPVLSEYYPEYVARFSSDTNMIIDSFDYKIEHLSTSHLYPFFSIVRIVDVTSILWNKYIYQRMIQTINDSSKRYISENINLRTSKNLEFTITFVIPFIKFCNYPPENSWWETLFRPRPSPFLKVINREIYSTWSGEALINFKWRTYGRYYYMLMWMEFFALLGCFTVATTFSDDIIPVDTRRQLLTASIVLGSYHIFFEIRQIIYDPKEWVRDFWNILGHSGNALCHHVDHFADHTYILNFNNNILATSCPKLMRLYSLDSSN